MKQMHVAELIAEATLDACNTLQSFLLFHICDIPVLFVCSVCKCFPAFPEAPMICHQAFCSEGYYA
jgi:hypothetical protein